MARRIFEFLCAEGHRSAALVPQGTQEIECEFCREPAQKVVSAPKVKLEGWSGAFPTAYDAWTRDHELRHKQAKKRQQEQEAV